MFPVFCHFFVICQTCNRSAATQQQVLTGIMNETIIGLKLLRIIINSEAERNDTF